MIRTSRSPRSWCASRSPSSIRKPRCAKPRRWRPKLQRLALEGRTDLRDVPLPTIDPEDARDHDDAVWVERRGDGYRALDRHRRRQRVRPAGLGARPGSPQSRLHHLSAGPRDSDAAGGARRRPVFALAGAGTAVSVRDRRLRSRRDGDRRRHRRRRDALGGDADLRRGGARPRLHRAGADAARKPKR